MKRAASPSSSAWPVRSKPSTLQGYAGHDELLHFFNQSLDMICIANLEGYFELLNPAWKTTLGWTPRELQARPFAEFVHPDDRPATLAEVAKLGRGGVVVRFENRYRCRDDSYRWL